MLNDKWQVMQQLIDREPVADVHAKRSWRILVINRFLTENILLMLLLYISLMLGTLSQNPNLLWPASGTACAFAFLRGFSILPGIFLGSLFTYYFLGANFNTSWQCAFIWTWQTGILLMVSYRFISPTLFYTRRIVLLKFISFAAVITAISSMALTWILQDQLTPITLLWWFADFNGILYISFAIIAWDLAFPDIHQLKNNVKIPLLLLLMCFAGVILLFFPAIHLIFLLIIIYCAMSLFYGWLACVAALFSFAMMLLLANLFTPLYSFYFYLYGGALLTATGITGLLLSLQKK